MTGSSPSPWPQLSVASSEWPCLTILVCFCRNFVHSLCSEPRAAQGTFFLAEKVGEGKRSMELPKGDGADLCTRSRCSWWQKPRDSKSEDPSGQALLGKPPFLPQQNGVNDKEPTSASSTDPSGGKKLGGEPDQVQSGGCKQHVLRVESRPCRKFFRSQENP